MTKKNVFLIILVAALGGLSLYMNRDHFATPPIQITHRDLIGRGRRQNRGGFPGETMHFLLDREVRLTSIKVLPLNTVETNKNSTPLWHLVSDSGSVPVKLFSYGFRIEGMEPAVKGEIATPLEAGGSYRILIEAGHQKAVHDFTLPPAPPAGS
jgi:hypothetical protein